MGFFLLWLCDTRSWFKRHIKLFCSFFFQKNLNYFKIHYLCSSLQKLRRRLSALDKKTKWSKDKKELVRGLLSSKSAHKYMSSDEEGDDGFISHPFSWESESFRSVKDSLDKKFLETCPVRSKRLLSKRTRGSLKDEEPPTLPEQFMWIVSP